MASREESCHRRGPYFHGSNFASWKNKMHMHIFGHNLAFWAAIVVGIQSEFFQDAQGKLERGQTCRRIEGDILFNSFCPDEFNKISCLGNTREIWDTHAEIHEGTASVKESKLDVLHG